MQASLPVTVAVVGIDLDDLLPGLQKSDYQPLVGWALSG
jgi:hypothetical protein